MKSEQASPTQSSSVFTATCFLTGIDRLRELGITKVFDLRSDTEIEKYDTPVPEIEGIEIIRAPVFQKEDYSPEMMAK